MIQQMMLLFASISILAAQGSPHGPLKNACTNCHSTDPWKELAVPMKFSHASTAFPLSGAHANASCIQRHSSKRFAGTPSDCFACHSSDFAKAWIPNHLLGKYSHDCLQCRSISAWKPSAFIHSKIIFPLTGAHISIDCSQRHKNNRYAGLAAACFRCCHPRG